MRLVGRTPEAIRFQFTREVKLPTELQYHKDAVLELDLKTKAVAYAESPELAKEAARLLLECQADRTLGDVTARRLALRRDAPKPEPEETQAEPQKKARKPRGRSR